MKKTSFCLKISLGALLLAGCAKTPEEIHYSKTPTEKSDITFLLSNFERQNNTNAETNWDDNFNHNASQAGGYMYTYDDPGSTVDDIHPWAAESPHCTVCDEDVATGEDGSGTCCSPTLAAAGVCKIGEFSISPASCSFSSGVDVNNVNKLPKELKSELSLHVYGTSAGNGVGWGVYFQDTDVPGGKATRALKDMGQEGLVFWAVGSAKISVSLTMPELAPIEDGGLCDPSAGEKCFDYHAKTIVLDGSWREYYIPWDEFRQEGWGIPVELDPNAINNIQFKFVAPDNGVQEFDAWFDHVGFYGGKKWDFVKDLADTDTGIDTMPITVDTSVTDTSVTDTSVTDTSVTDTSVTDTSVTDTSVTDTAATDTNATDTATVK